MNKSIHQLADDGNVEAIRRLVDAFPDVISHVDSLGNAPIHYACGGDHLEVLKLLIDSGANVNQPGRFGETPLHCVIMDSEDAIALPLVRELLRVGADPSIIDTSGNAPIHYAKIQQSGLSKTIALLIEFENSRL
jgi:ankyrin repeat protein